MVLQHVRTTKLSLIELLLYLRSQRGDTVIFILLARDRSREDERGRNYYRLLLFAFRLHSRSFLSSSFSFHLLRYPLCWDIIRTARWEKFVSFSFSSLPCLLFLAFLLRFLQFVPRFLSFSLSLCHVSRRVSFMKRIARIKSLASSARSVCVTASVIITEPVLPLTRPVNLNRRLFGPPRLFKDWRQLDSNVWSSRSSNTLSLQLQSILQCRTTSTYNL